MYTKANFIKAISNYAIGLALGLSISYLLGSSIPNLIATSILVFIFCAGLEIGKMIGSRDRCNHLKKKCVTYKLRSRIR